MLKFFKGLDKPLSEVVNFNYRRGSQRILMNPS